MKQLSHRSEKQSEGWVVKMHASDECKECEEQVQFCHCTEICGGCNGSGEGMHDGSKCFTCKGSGEEPLHDRDLMDFDYDPDNYDPCDSYESEAKNWAGMDGY